MAAVLVRPAGAGHESLFVALACCVILAAAGAVVGVRAAHVGVTIVEAHQLDARDGLSAAEQGLYADLRLVPIELTAWGGVPPAVAELAAALVPPFVADLGMAWRGAHSWSLIEHAGMSAYLGLSAEPAVAGSFLLVLPLVGEADSPPKIWLHRESDAAAPARFDAGVLVEAGWREIVSRFDAGVTRHKH